MFADKQATYSINELKIFMIDEYIPDISMHVST